jgi:hypothetical protein
MQFRQWARQRGARSARVMGLIFSLLHTPLPQPDYHNIRHHDGPGQVCAYHDHLLRWHPRAQAADDVAVLHWHWLVPVSGRADAPTRGDGPAWHAHVVDWDAGVWDSGPPQLGAATIRFAERPAPCPLAMPAPALANVLLLPLASHPPQAFSATFAPRVSLASLLQRWAC